VSFSLRTLLRSASLLFVGELGNAALVFLSSIIVARALGPANYGAWGVVMAVTATVQTFLSFRIQEPLTRYLVVYRDSGDRRRLAALLGSSLMAEATACFAAALVVLLAAPAANALTPGAGDIVAVYRIYAISLLFSSLNTIFYCVARDERRFKLLSTVSPAMSALQCAVLLVLYTADLINLMSLAIMFASVSAIRSAIYGAYLHRALRRHFGMPGLKALLMAAFATRHAMGPFWDFMRSTYIASSVSSLAKSADVVLLAYFRSETEVGWYRLAKSVLSLVQTASTSLTSVIYRDLLDHVAAGSNTLIAGLKRLLIVTLPLAALATATAIVISGPVVRIAYGDAYTPAAQLIDILLPGYAIVFALFWGQPLMLSQGQHRPYLYSVIAWSVATIAGVAFGGWTNGAVGVAIASSLSWAAIAVVQALIALRFQLRRGKVTSDEMAPRSP
jgi:O-antigen/teichoic acid export membrane protein